MVNDLFVTFVFLRCKRFGSNGKIESAAYSEGRGHRFEPCGVHQAKILDQFHRVNLPNQSSELMLTRREHFLTSTNLIVFVREDLALMSLPDFFLSYAHAS